MADFPKIFRLRQSFDDTRVEDPANEVHRQLTLLKLYKTLQQGQTVAITAGSRGIANFAEIIRAIVDHLKQLGAKPFIVPAMGSHGGGTAEGQRRVIEGYGITEAAVGCPIRATMETVVVGRAAEGFDIHFDRAAYEADHVIVCNRVKPHTGFAGPIESGLMKMLLIGLGNRAGAEIYHRAIQDYSFERIVRGVAGEVIRRCRVLAGVAVVENAYDRIAKIEAVAARQIESREPELLLLAKRLMPRLPFERADVLLIDRIGKNISGTGMDPNVVGRKFDDHKAVADEWPKIKRIAVRGLTPESRGNAVGIGMAEFCRSQLLAEMDAESTRLNVLVSGHVAAAMAPLDYATDRDMLAAALRTIGLTEPPAARLMWIADTLHLAEVECSAAYLSEAESRRDLQILAAPRDLPIGGDGNLPSWS